MNMRYFLLGFALGISSGLWPAADDSPANTKNNQLWVSEELQWVMRELGVTRDPGAVSVFVDAVTCPVHYYVLRKPDCPMVLKPLPQIKSDARSRALALCRLLEHKEPYFMARPYATASRFWQCLYYGVVPAINVVNRYYRAKNKIREMIPLMQRAYFWDEYGVMCGMSKNPERRLQACANVLKMVSRGHAQTSLAYAEAGWYASQCMSDKVQLYAAT